VDSGSESKDIPKEENVAIPVVSTDSLRNIDLNAITNENDDKKASVAADTSLPEPPSTEGKHEEILGWPLPDVDKMAIDSTQLAQLGRPLEEEEEDYDEEEG